MSWDSVPSLFSLTHSDFLWYWNLWWLSLYLAHISIHFIITCCYLYLKYHKSEWGWLQWRTSRFVHEKHVFSNFAIGGFTSETGFWCWRKQSQISKIPCSLCLPHKSTCSTWHIAQSSSLPFHLWVSSYFIYIMNDYVHSCLQTLNILTTEPLLFDSDPEAQFALLHDQTLFLFFLSLSLFFYL